MPKNNIAKKWSKELSEALSEEKEAIEQHYKSQLDKLELILNKVKSFRKEIPSQH